MTTLNPSFGYGPNPDCHDHRLPAAWIATRPRATDLDRKVFAAEDSADPQTTGSWQGRLQLPVRGGVYASGFRTAHRPQHHGIDIAAPAGTPVLAALPGYVLEAGGGGQHNGGQGNYVNLVSTEGHTALRHLHLSSIAVRPGQWVDAGQKIGSVGSTGGCSTPHLHFEVRTSGQQITPLSIYHAPARDPVDWLSPEARSALLGHKA